MGTDRKFIVVCAFALLLLLPKPDLAFQQSKSLLATANGKGTLKVGKEHFAISTVIVKLLEDGKAEITLVSDIAIFVTGTWSGGDNPQQGIDVKLTGGATAGGLEGGGKILLRDDGKSIASLTLQGTNRTTKRNVAANFTAK